MSDEEKQLLNPFVWVVSFWGSLLNVVAQLSTLVLADSVVSGVLLLGLVFVLMVAALSFSGVVLQILDGDGEAD